jgi:hypothetical protein
MTKSIIIYGDSADRAILYCTETDPTRILERFQTYASQCEMMRFWLTNLVLWGTYETELPEWVTPRATAILSYTGGYIAVWSRDAETGEETKVKSEFDF